MLEHGADPNACDAHNDPALMWAAHGGSPEVIRCLIQAGAIVNVQSDTGYSPLIWAVQFGTAEEVKVLLEHGADVSLVDSWGQTALDKAVNKPEVTAMLQCER